MVEFDINLNERGYGSIPKELREVWGRRLSVIPNNTAGVIFKKGADLEDVKISLEILMKDVEHRIAQEKRAKNKRLEDFEECIKGDSGDNREG